MGLAELSRRHQSDWHQRYEQLRASHPTWSSGRTFYEAINQERRAHREEFLELLTGYAGARLAGAKLVYKLTRRAQRRLQLAHPEEYQALYAAERQKIGNPVQRSVPWAGRRGVADPVSAAAGLPQRRAAGPCAPDGRPCQQDSPTGTGGTIPTNATIKEASR